MKSENKNTVSLREKAIGKVHSGLTTIFGRARGFWAEWMKRKTASLSKRTLYFSLFLFIAFSVTYNSMVLIGVQKTGEIGFGKINLPRKTPPPTILDDAYSTEVKRLKNFTRYMDSLNKSSTGKATYDSIMNARPGLLDSAKAIEELINKF